MTEKEDMIIDSLKRINNKLDSHEEKFDGIATTLKKLVEVDVKMKEYDGSLRRAFKRIEGIEMNQQKTGCSVLNSHLKVREEQLKKYDNIIAESEKRLEKAEDTIDEIRSIPNKILMRVAMALSGALAVWFFGYIIVEHSVK